MYQLCVDEGNGGRRERDNSRRFERQLFPPSRRPLPLSTQNRDTRLSPATPTQLAGITLEVYEMAQSNESSIQFDVVRALFISSSVVLRSKLEMAIWCTLSNIYVGEVVVFLNAFTPKFKKRPCIWMHQSEQWVFELRPGRAVSCVQKFEWTESIARKCELRRHKCVHVGDVLVINWS